MNHKNNDNGSLSLSYASIQAKNAMESTFHKAPGDKNKNTKHKSKQGYANYSDNDEHLNGRDDYDYDHDEQKHYSQEKINHKNETI